MRSLGAAFTASAKGVKSLLSLSFFLLLAVALTFVLFSQQSAAIQFFQSPVSPPEVQRAPADTDGDGVADEVDACPNQAGKTNYKGCPPPDSDGDGVNDEVDACPNEVGSTSFNGCPAPDSDSDGVVDEMDACPNEVGTTNYDGCPPPDSDGDGVADEVDACPNQAGTASFNGCPSPQVETMPSPVPVPPQEPLGSPLQPTEAPIAAPEAQPTRRPEMVVDQGLLIDTTLVYAAYVWLCCGVTTFLTVPVMFLGLYVWGKRRLNRIETQE